MSATNPKISGADGKLETRDGQDKVVPKFLESLQVPTVSRPQALQDSVKSAFSSPVRTQFPGRAIITSIQSSNVPTSISVVGSPQAVITKTAVVSRPMPGELPGSRPTPPTVSQQLLSGSLSATGSTLTTSSSAMASIIRGPVHLQPAPTGGHPNIQATYSSHVPRGAAAVACMTALKSAVATPIARPSHIFGSNIVSSSAPHIQPRASVLANLRPSSSPLHGVVRSAPPMSMTSSVADGIRPLASHGPNNPMATQLLIANPRSSSEALTHPSIVHASSSVSKVHSYVQHFPQIPEKVFYKSSTATTTAPTAPIPITASPGLQQQQQQQQHPSSTGGPQLLPSMSHHQQRGATPPSSSGIVVGVAPQHRLQLAQQGVGPPLTTGPSVGPSPAAVTTVHSSSHGHPYQMIKISTPTIHAVSSHHQPSTNLGGLMSTLARPVVTASPISSGHCAPRAPHPTSSSAATTAVTAIPVAKVYPQSLALATRPSLSEVSSSSSSAGHNVDATRNLTAVPLYTTISSASSSVSGVLGASSLTTTAVSRVSSSAQVAPSSVVFTDSRQERTTVMQTPGQFTIQPTAAYYYEPYQPQSVPSTLTMHSFPGPPTSHSFTAIAAPTLRAGLLAPHQASGVAMHAPSAIRGAPATASTTSVVINPMIAAASLDNVGAKPDSTTSSLFNHPSSINAAHSSVNPSQSTSSTASANPSSSPRPSILRKRTIDGASAHVRKNLLSSIPTSQPSSPRPDSSGLSASNGTEVSKTPYKLREITLENGQSNESGESNCNGIHPLNVVVKQEPPDTSESTSAASTSTTNSQVSNNVPPAIVAASPRKKPRKQQLTGNELVEMHSTEGEEEFEKLRKTVVKKEVVKEAHFLDEDGVRWVCNRKRPPIALLNGYRLSWKSRHNHFMRYSDVKPKERRLAVSDIANQKGVLQKANGWKVHHICSQMDDLVALEGTVNSRLSSILTTLESKTGSKDDDQDLNRANEFLKGNIQRCKMIMDQMKEAKQQAMKVIDHKSRIVEIVNRYIVKQPNRKRDKN